MFLLTLAASAALAAASTRADQEPCAVVNSAVAASTGKPAFDAAVALACLKSVPLQKESNQLALKAFRKISEFESKIAYLKNPPPGSLQPAVDLLGALDDIESKLQNDYYKNEFDFNFDVWTLARSTGDYHYEYNVDIMNVFTWEREQAIVSISSDGIELPQIYLKSDVSAIKAENKASPITKINDIDVETWLNNYAIKNRYDHDPDASYNAIFFNPSLSIRPDGSNGTFASTPVPQDGQTKLTFANGTSFNLGTTATTDASKFKGITDGASFFQRFCTGQTFDASSPDTEVTKRDTTVSLDTNVIKRDTGELNSFTAVPTQTAVAPIGSLFPKPLVLTSDYAVAGYLPDSLPDTAILHLPVYEAANNKDLEFQNAVRGLLATAQEQGRKKLIVDLRGNGGGTVQLGYTTFLEIMPQLSPYAGTTLRSPAWYQDIAAILYDYRSTTPADQWPQEVSAVSGTAFDITWQLDNDGKPFSSAQAQYGPYTVYNDNQTAIVRPDLNRNITGIHFPGRYGTSLAPQVFQPNDIVLLQDGFCGSTCAVFAELMKSQGLVKTVVVGGRKQNGPMQGVGGTKGAQVITLQDVTTAYNAAVKIGNATALQSLSSVAKDAVLGAPALANRTSQGKNARINVRNNIRQGDQTLTPLQFVYEAADCRMFNTPEMYESQVVLYKMVHDIHWGNGSCVPGSVNDPSSLSGNLLSYINSYPPQGANFTFNATDSPFPSGVANAASTITLSGTRTPAPTTGSTLLAASTTYIGTVPSKTASPSASTSARSGASSNYHAEGLFAVVAAAAANLLLSY